MNIICIFNKSKPRGSKTALALILFIIVCGTCLYASETPDRETVKKYDKKGLLSKPGMVTDHSKKMLEVPKMYNGDNSFVMAKTPPTVDFAAVRDMNPYFYPEDNPCLWSSWSYCLYWCFYHSQWKCNCQHRNFHCKTIQHSSPH